MCFIGLFNYQKKKSDSFLSGRFSNLNNNFYLVFNTDLGVRVHPVAVNVARRGEKHCGL